MTFMDEDNYVHETIGSMYFSVSELVRLGEQRGGHFYW
jgi:hypothetical protein